MKKRNIWFICITKFLGALLLLSGFAGGFLLALTGLQSSHRVLLAFDLFVGCLTVLTGMVLALCSDSYHIRGKKRVMWRAARMTIFFGALVAIGHYSDKAPTDKLIVCLFGTLPATFLFSIMLDRAGEIGDWLEGLFLALFVPKTSS